MMLRVAVSLAEYVLRFFLKTDKVGKLFTLRGSEFQDEGQAKAKARWPKFALVRGKCKVILWDERSYG